MIRTAKRMFDWRLRGVRVIEIFGVVCLAAMVFSVYIAKTAAAGQSQKIGELEHRIADESERVRILRAEAARLEQPARLEALARDAGLVPVDVDRRADEAALPGVAPGSHTPLPNTVAPVVEDEAVSPDMLTAAPAATPAEAPR